MPTATTLKTALWTVVILAAAYRFGGKEIIEGRQKFLGIF